jgi:predicted DNA-binding protein
MSARRTQIYFSQEQRQRIDRAAAARGVTMAELVREAVDRFLTVDSDATESLSSTFGACPEASVPSRDQWNRG